MLLSCASRQISIALTAGKLGYKQVHGHDILVEACYCGSVDVELIFNALEGVLSRLDRRLLDDAIGVEGAIVEDLLDMIIKKLPEELSGSILCRLAASWGAPPRRVELHLDVGREAFKTHR